MPETVLITGATRGLGRALTEELVGRGFRVFATGRDRRKLDDLSRALEGRDGQVVPIPMDVACDESVREARQAVGDRTQTLDCLVNNAGVILESGIPFEALPAALVAQTVGTNALGAFRTAQAFSDLLSRSANPRIVNVSSGMGVMGDMGPGTTAYRVSKAAMNVISLQSHYALQPKGIRVIAVCPGWVRTDMGGPNASRDIATGISGVLWAVDTDRNGPSGEFFRDGKEISW